MRSLRLLVGLFLILAAPPAALAAKPTVTVIIPGWTPGDGRQIEPKSLKTLGEEAGQTLADAGSDNKTIYYKWPSHGNNEQAVADLALQIKAEAAEMGTEVDLQIVGHSRGGIVACEVLDKIGEDPQFGYVQGVLLDPTAAVTAGDRFPSKKPAGVDRLINYYDGKNGIQIAGGFSSDYPGWRNTRSDRDIAGAENHKLDLGGGDTHVTIVESYASGFTVGNVPGQTVTHGAAADSETFYEQKEGVGSYTTVPEQDRGSNQKIVMQTPKNDQERLSGPVEKGLHDVFDAAGQAASDSAREYHNVLRGDVASSESPKHWEEMTDKSWIHGRDLAAGGAQQFGRNLENGAQHTKEMLQRGGRRLEQNTRDFVQDPGRTLEKGLSHTGREIERLGNHYAGGAVDLAEHELNMAATGVKHAGRMLDKQGEKAARSLQADGKSASDYLDGDRFSSDERTLTRPLADTVREGSKLAGDVVREGGQLGGDVLEAGGHAGKDVTREGGQAANDLSQTASRAAKDTLTAGGKAAGDSGREIKRTADAAGKRARVFAGDAAREGRQAGHDIAREGQSLPGNLQRIAQRPDRALVTGRNNARRVFSNAEDRAAGALSQARDKALSDAARAEERTGQALSRGRDRVLAAGAKNVERGGQVLTRTRDRVQAQAAGFEQNAGQTLTGARDRASENLASAEQNAGRTLSRTRDRVVAATQNAQKQVTQGLSDVGQQMGSTFNDGRDQLGNAWNNFREQVPQPLPQPLPQPGGWLNQQPVRQNPLADFGRNLAEALQREQAQRAQEIARQQALAAQQAAQRQAEAARRRIEEARQAAIARDNARRQAEFLRQQAAEQARRREAEIRAAADRAQRDAQRELSNAGKYLEERGNSVIGGAKKVFGW